MNPDDLALLAYLEGFLTAARREKIARVAGERTRYLTVLVEDIYQPHNASAVLRSMDALGVQDVHIVENRNRYQVNPGVALGSSRWLTMHRYKGEEDNTADAVGNLRASGYRIVATSPRPESVPLEDLDLEAGPVAILLGNELDGLSEKAFSQADETIRIPMYGFVESFNISVSAALILHSLVTRLRRSAVDWRLSEEDILALRLAWTRIGLGRSQALEREFRSRDTAGQ